MLQRSQSLFLLAAFILSLLLLLGPIARLTLEGSEYILQHSGLFDATGENQGVATWPLSVIFISATVLSFLAIFFYRNRMRQMRITMFLILLNAGIIGMMFYYTWVARNLLEGSIILHQWRFIVPPVNIVLLYFAYRRIRRDELLVKAFDRIR